MQTLESVSGTWRLIYSSTLTTIAVLSASRLPLLAVGDYVQMVDTSSMTVTDKVG